jgi:hypothetical protein
MIVRQPLQKLDVMAQFDVNATVEVAASRPGWRDPPGPDPRLISMTSKTANRCASRLRDP